MFLDAILKRRRKADPNRAIAFVDLEHWFFSYKNLYGLTPDLPAWREELARQYTMDDIMAFGDFSNCILAKSLDEVRSITSTVISTQQSSSHHKKDMTDFIMLDYIYQVSAANDAVGTYILFTGDGHFHSVVKYLTQKLGKRVVIYGVTNAVSKSLKAVATEVHELPAEQTVIKSRYAMIVENLAYVAEHDAIIPSFKGTVAAVARQNGVGEEEISAALQEMLDKGLVRRKDRRVDFNRKVKVIAPDWEALIAAGLWKP